MDFSMTKEQEMLKKEARRFLEKECTEEFVREIEKKGVGYSPDLWRKVADLGWLGLIFPEQYGGLGGDLLDLAFVYEEMGKAMFPGPHLSTVVLCGTMILSAGTEAQKKSLPDSDFRRQTDIFHGVDRTGFRLGGYRMGCGRHHGQSRFQQRSVCDRWRKIVCS